MLLSNTDGALTFDTEKPFSYVSLSSIGISFLIYMPLAVVMSGLAMPFGMFIPNLFMGAAIGRFGGEILHSDAFSFLKEVGSLAHPGLGGVLGALFLVVSLYVCVCFYRFYQLVFVFVLRGVRFFLAYFE